MVACHHCGKQFQVVPPPSGASPQFGTVTAAPPVLEPVGALLWQSPNGGDDLAGRRHKGKKTTGVSGLVLGLSIGGGTLLLIGLIVLAAVLMSGKGDDSKEASNIPPVDSPGAPAEQAKPARPPEQPERAQVEQAPRDRDEAESQRKTGRKVEVAEKPKPPEPGGKEGDEKTAPPPKEYGPVPSLVIPGKTGAAAYDTYPEPWRTRFVEVWKDKVRNAEDQVARNAEQLREIEKLVEEADERCNELASDRYARFRYEAAIETHARLRKGVAPAQQRLSAAKVDLRRVRKNDPPYFASDEEKQEAEFAALPPEEQEGRKAEAARRAEAARKAEAELQRKAEAEAIAAREAEEVARQRKEAQRRAEEERRRKAEAEAEAARKAAEVKHGDLQVRIAKASIGKVPLKDIFVGATKSKDALLMVRLELLNTNPTKKVEYHTWSGRSISFERDYATLKDNFGNSYRRIGFGLGTYPVGAVERFESIYPNKPVTEVLVFEVPLDTATYLDLELPATNIGSTGMIRFRIPMKSVSRGPE
jgi:hypothetical protein